MALIIMESDFLEDSNLDPTLLDSLIKILEEDDNLLKRLAK